MVVNALEVSGHTDHSTVYFLRGKNLLFSGDAIGSGGGVRIFSAKGFGQFEESADQFIDCIHNPTNDVDASKLLVYGGHYWQKSEKEKLTIQYILNMRTLIEEIRAGRAKEESVSLGPYLDTNFSYGEATIT